MLLVPTYRAASSIHGTGVFVREFVPRGTVVWEFTPGFDVAVDPWQLETLPESAKEPFLNYSYLDRVEGQYVLCADDARFMNHSAAPSTVDDTGAGAPRYGRTVAARDLVPGDELTCDYREFDVSEHHVLDAPTAMPAGERPERTSWVAAHLELRVHPGKGGGGLFATRPIEAGEVLLVWGGEAVDGEELARMSARDRRFSVQVDEDVFLAPSRRELEPGDFINHCCAPNAGLRGQLTIVAMRRIEPGEEVCFDYAMTDSAPYDEFDCACGAPRCRGRVTADDWRRPDLQHRYRGFFSTYLELRIAEQRVPVHQLRPAPALAQQIGS